ncbi:hypothetical protein ISN45_Aa07g032720 [Arabidopsis thaliana x Arabidopsis arenosa]|uniref:Uncharacterized protein n=1 Tax=Arabidopsis thaliana x Arabidopsis arenosa TaxID=1240361 RepID=A0A8T1Y9G3_9BRAS|nr:hypothetical protein ISN45_Aa07g032720 [Arabidopsis thaliana x Arabidopsis arenosa]
MSDKDKEESSQAQNNKLLMEALTATLTATLTANMAKMMDERFEANERSNQGRQNRDTRNPSDQEAAHNYYSQSSTRNSHRRRRHHKEEPPDPTPLPLTVMISSNEHTANLIQVSNSLTRFVSHVSRTVTMSLSHLGNSEKELELFKENLEPNSCLRTQVKHEHFKDNALIKVEACLLVYSDSMTMKTHLLFAKAVDNIAGIKEEPPDIEVLSSNLFERTGIGVVLMPRIDSPSNLTRRRSDNAYALELQGKYNVSSNFNDSYLVLFIVGELDLRSNPFQVGEDDVTMESTKDLELDKELVAEEQLEAEKQLEPEERFELRNELIAEKEYGKDVILTSLVLIYDHQMGMCLICTLFPLSSFVPMGFLDKVFNEANDSHSNHPFGDPNHGITFRIPNHGIYMESSLFYAHYKPKKSPNQVVNLLVKKDDENRRSRVIFEAKGSEESFLFKFYL